MLPQIRDMISRFVFPERCVACGARDTFFCKPCLAKVPLPDHILDKNIFSFLSYRDESVREAIRLMKYRSGKKIAELLGMEAAHRFRTGLSTYLFGGISTGYPHLLVPIPLSAQKMRERGYNQAELLAQAIKDNMPSLQLIVRTDMLIKTRETECQAKLKGADARRKNIRGCFSIMKQSDARGRTIILVDDVATTGSTIFEARKQLLRKGAARVYAITVAA